MGLLICSPRLRVKACLHFMRSAEELLQKPEEPPVFLLEGPSHICRKVVPTRPPSHLSDPLLPATVVVLSWDWMSFPPKNGRAQSELFQTVPT